MKLKLTDASKSPVRVGDILQVVSISPADEAVVLLLERESAQESPPTLGVSVGDGAHAVETLR